MTIRKQMRSFGRFCGLLPVLVAALIISMPVWAADTIKIGVIAPEGITPGKALLHGAEMAAADINRSGGINGKKIVLIQYDSKLSASAGVLAMKKAVNQDHVAAVTGVFSSEVALTLMPWAHRLNTPLILESGSTEIGEMIHRDYDQYQNVFQLQLNSYYIAQEVCDAAHQLLVKGKGYSSAVIMSENAAWTRPLNKAYKQCLPKAGLSVKKVINYAVETQDFGPVYSHINSVHPDVIVTGMAHTGLRPVIQWHAKQVPALMLGFNIQSGTGGFWNASNGAASDTLVVTNGAGGAPMTSKTAGFYKRYRSQYKQEPMLLAYTSYDAILAVADAIDKAKSTETGKLVKQLGATNLVGVTGRIQFYGRDAKYTHALKYGKGLVTGVAFQWQHGKQRVVWPKNVAQENVHIPSYIAR